MSNNMEVGPFVHFGDLDIGFNEEFTTTSEFSFRMNAYMTETEVLFQQNFPTINQNDLFSAMNSYDHMAMESPISQVLDNNVVPEDIFKCGIEEQSIILELEEVNMTNSVTEGIKQVDNKDYDVADVDVTSTEILGSMLQERSVNFDNSSNEEIPQIFSSFSPSQSPLNDCTCQICHKTLCSISNLRRHIQNVHLNPKKPKLTDISSEDVQSSSQFVQLFGNGILNTPPNLRKRKVNRMKRKATNRFSYAKGKGTYSCGTCQTTTSHHQSFIRHIVRVHLKRPTKMGWGRHKYSHLTRPPSYNGPELTGSLMDGVAGIVRYFVVKPRRDGSIYLHFDPLKDSKISDVSTTGTNLRAGGKPPETETDDEITFYSSETTNAETKSDTDKESRTGDFYDGEKSHAEEKSAENFHTGKNPHTEEKSKTVKKLPSDQKKNPRTRKQNSTKPKAFKCELCPTEFSQIYNARRHLSSVHTFPDELTSRGCPTCGQRFENLRFLKRHLRYSHAQSYTYSCPKSNCKETFSNIRKYNSHMINHGFGGQIQITSVPPKPNLHAMRALECPSQPSKPEVRKMHESGAKKQPDKLCGFCGKLFTRQEFLELHIQGHISGELKNH